MNDICQIPTERLLPNPYQPRHQFDSEDMLSLADSIKENGILQPLLIRRINNSEYFEVIAGVSDDLGRQYSQKCPQSPALNWIAPLSRVRYSPFSRMFSAPT